MKQKLEEVLRANLEREKASLKMRSPGGWDAVNRFSVDVALVETQFRADSSKGKEETILQLRGQLREAYLAAAAELASHEGYTGNVQREYVRLDTHYQLLHPGSVKAGHSPIPSIEESVRTIYEFCNPNRPPRPQEDFDMAFLKVYEGAANRIKLAISDWVRKIGKTSPQREFARRNLRIVQGTTNLVEVALAMGIWSDETDPTNMPAKDPLNAKMNVYSFAGAARLPNQGEPNVVYGIRHFLLASDNVRVQKAGSDYLEFIDILESIRHGGALVKSLNYIGLDYASSKDPAERKRMVDLVVRRADRTSAKIDYPYVFGYADAIGMLVLSGNYRRASNLAERIFEQTKWNNVVRLALLERTDHPEFIKQMRSLDDSVGYAIATAIPPDEMSAIPEQWRARASRYDWEHTYNPQIERGLNLKLAESPGK